MHRLSLKKPAFTVLEMLVVVVVVGILITSLLASFPATQEKSFRAAMQSDLRNFATARALHVAENEMTPASLAEVTGHDFSADVYPLGYQSPTSSEWLLVVGHRRTATRCALYLASASGESSLITCGSEDNLPFSVALAGTDATFDAQQALSLMAFQPSSGLFRSLWAAPSTSIIHLSWEFGDGTFASGTPAQVSRVRHVYATPGHYQVRLILVDRQGKIGMGSLETEVTPGITEEEPLALPPRPFDIRPGSDAEPAPVNPGENGVLPMGLYRTLVFDPTTLRPESLRIGTVGLASKGKNKVHYEQTDLDGDGDLDVKVAFDIPALVSAGVLNSASTSLTITGTHTNNTPFTGTDLIRVVPH